MQRYLRVTFGDQTMLLSQDQAEVVSAVMEMFSLKGEVIPGTEDIIKLRFGAKIPNNTTRWNLVLIGMLWFSKHNSLLIGEWEVKESAVITGEWREVSR